MVIRLPSFSNRLILYTIHPFSPWEAYYLHVGIIVHNV